VLVRLPDDHGPGVTQRCDDGRVCPGRRPIEEGCARPGGARPGDVEEILNGHGHAVERARGPGGVQLLGPHPGVVGEHRGEGVEPRLARLDGLERSFDSVDH